MPVTQDRPTVIVKSPQPAGAQSPRAPRQSEDGQLVLVPVNRLKSCRYQRRAVAPDKVRHLADTIRKNGLLQSVTARPISGDPQHDYELIAGHRRTAAFRLLLDEASTPE